MLRFKRQLKANGEDFSGEITGTSPEFSEIRNFHPARGRFLVQQDLEEWRRVVVLGHEIAAKLFGERAALGKEVKIGDERFFVIGVMESKGSLHVPSPAKY